MKHFLLIFLVLSTILTASELDTVWYYATNDIVAEEIVQENRIDEDAYSALEECQIELDIQRTKWRRKALKRFVIGLIGGAVIGITAGVIIAH
jgi:hypothetical protein